MSLPDLRIAGGSVVLPDGAQEVDLLIEAGRIVGLVAPEAVADAAKVVDVSGLVVLPGVVDAHVHLGQDITVPRVPADVVAETESAALGGITTIIPYLMLATPYDTAFDEVVRLMEANARTDFGLHFCMVTREQLEELPRYVDELGVSSFKFFMNFRGDEGAYLGLPGNDDGFLFDLLEAAARAGAMVNPHGENVELIWRLREGPIPAGLTDLATWNHLRPALAEAEAQQRAATLAEAAGASMYAVHVTNASCLDALQRVRERYPNVFLETCPHYLLLDTTCELGPRAKVNPPLREPADREALWAALAEGAIDVVGSDHVPRHVSAKDGGLSRASAGFPGMQTLLPLLLSKGCRERGLPLERVAEITAARPARLFGLHPQKGRIAIGADADLAIVDLNAPGEVVAAPAQRSGAEFTVYDGIEVGVRVVHTLVRGRFSLEDGKLAAAALGKYQRREHSGAAALGRAA